MSIMKNPYLNEPTTPAPRIASMPIATTTSTIVEARQVFLVKLNFKRTPRCRFYGQFPRKQDAYQGQSPKLSPGMGSLERYWLIEWLRAPALLVPLSLYFV